MLEMSTHVGLETVLPACNGHLSSLMAKYRGFPRVRGTQGTAKDHCFPPWQLGSGAAPGAGSPSLAVGVWAGARGLPAGQGAQWHTVPCLCWGKSIWADCRQPVRGEKRWHYVPHATGSLHTWDVVTSKAGNWNSGRSACVLFQSKVQP